MTLNQPAITLMNGTFLDIAATNSLTNGLQRVIAMMAMAELHDLQSIINKMGCTDQNNHNRLLPNRKHNMIFKSKE
jgi:hypothetical protein